MEVDPDPPGPARPATNTSVVVMGQPLVGKTPEEATDGLSGVQARLQGMDMDEPRASWTSRATPLGWRDRAG